MKTAMLLLGAIVSVAAQYPGWWIPPGGHSERSPLSAEPGTIARGKALYAANCARCHGPEGKGDGPGVGYAADLTDDLRIELNTEGKLGKDQVWTLVEYLKILRTARPQASARHPADGEVSDSATAGDISRRVNHSSPSGCSHPFSAVLALQPEFGRPGGDGWRVAPQASHFADQVTGLGWTREDGQHEPGLVDGTAVVRPAGRPAYNRHHSRGTEE